MTDTNPHVLMAEDALRESHTAETPEWCAVSVGRAQTEATLAVAWEVAALRKGRNITVEAGAVHVEGGGMKDRSISLGF